MVKKIALLYALLAFGMAFGQSGEEWNRQQEQIKLALKSADECEKRGDWKQAKSILWGANETYPRDRHITYRLGLLQVRDKEYSAALETFRSTRHDIEWDRNRYSYVGYLLLKSGDVSASRKLWVPEAVVRQSARFSDWVHMLPNTETDVGLEAAWLIAIAYSVHPDETLTSWQAVLTLAPNNSIAAGNAARILDDQKQWDKAIALYELALKNSVPGEWRVNLQERLGRARYYRDKKTATKNA